MFSSVLFAAGRTLTGVLALTLGGSALLGAPPPEPKEKAKSASAQVFSFDGTGKGRSFLGVAVREVDAALARDKGLDEARGVEITKVVPKSAAEAAGMKKGDVVLEYRGQRVEGVEQFIRLVRETPAGRQVTMRVNRQGDVRTVTANIGTCGKCGAIIVSKGHQRMIRIPDIPVPDVRIPDVPQVFTTWRSSRLGIEAEALKGQLADYFGVEEGVLVRSVMEDSAAAKAGLQAGDVILKIGDIRVATPREVSSAIREQKSRQLDIRLLRAGEEMSVSVSLEANSRGNGRLPRMRLDGKITRL